MMRDRVCDVRFGCHVNGFVEEISRMVDFVELFLDQIRCEIGWSFSLQIHTFGRTALFNCQKGSLLSL